MTADIENLIKSYAWSLDELDKDAWLGLFSEDLESYRAYFHGDPVPATQIPVAADDPEHSAIGGLSPKRQLEAKCDGMIFKRIRLAQSIVSNVVVTTLGPEAAKARDYFRHWEIVDPDHPASAARNLDDGHWYFQEGRHEWEFRKEGADWKVTKFKCVILRTESREIPGRR